MHTRVAVPLAALALLLVTQLLWSWLVRQPAPGSTAHPPPRRELGILAPVYSMRAETNDAGIGNFGHLRQLADVALVSGATVVGTLPLVATFPDQPSPYSPASRRAWNSAESRSIAR